MLLRPCAGSKNKMTVQKADSLDVLYKIEYLVISMLQVFIYEVHT
jgi:hypothetical protein